MTKKVFIATGSSTIVPKEFNSVRGVYTSDTIFKLEEFQESLTVVGMSVLGTEMAQAFINLGIKVTALHDSPFIGGLSDP